MRFAAAHKVPVISEGRNFAEAGALLTYGAYAFEIFKRGAVYVDRILKGAKPGDLPIEQPTEFELIANLRTAKALGLTIPQSVLERATEVIG
jgi:putative ABC transport system substrate-binding protein